MAGTGYRYVGTRSEVDRKIWDTFKDLAHGKHHVVEVLLELSDTLQRIALLRAQSRERDSRDADVKSHRSREDNKYRDGDRT